MGTTCVKFLFWECRSTLIWSIQDLLNSAKIQNDLSFSTPSWEFISVLGFVPLHSFTFLRMCLNQRMLDSRFKRMHLINNYVRNQFWLRNTMNSCYSLSQWNVTNWCIMWLKGFKCKVNINHLDQLIIVNKSWPSNPWIG